MLQNWTPEKRSNFQNASVHLMNSVLRQFEHQDAFYKCYI